MIISHRGNDIYGYKENTKKAIISTLKSDYTDGVEFDIRITKDNKFVINHDLIFNGKIIKNTNYKDLKLDELNNTLKKIKSDKIIIIEIKDNLKNINTLCKILKKYKHLNIYIHSFNYRMLKNIKLNYPNYKVGLIVSKLFNQDKNISIFDFISLNYRIYNNTYNDIFIWTINNKKNFKKYNSKNINIITDKPYLNVDY